MACVSDRTGGGVGVRVGVRVAALAAALLVLAALPRVAAADDCGGDGGFVFTLVTTRFAMQPSPGPGDRLGLDLWARWLDFTWGRGCGGRNRATVSEIEEPDHGDRDHAVMHFASYGHEWRAGDARVFGGVHTVTRFGTSIRFVTPMIGVMMPVSPELIVRAQLEASGVFAFGMHRAPRRLRDETALSASAVWPASSPVRGELRLRARRYQFDDGELVRDVTVTAGLGLARRGAEHQRVLPGFLGLALRSGEDRRVLVVAEFGFGVDNR